MSFENVNLALCSKQDLDELGRLRAENAQLRAALESLLTHDFAEECQECAIGQSQAWKNARREIGPRR